MHTMPAADHKTRPFPHTSPVSVTSYFQQKHGSAPLESGGSQERWKAVSVDA